MSECIFCRIVAGAEPASFVYRDEVCSAFMTIRPVNPGHLLVIPNAHAPHLADLDGETAAHLMRVGHRLAAALRASGLRCEGVNFLLADGKAASQAIFHTHLHVFPRHEGDGFGFRFGELYFQPPARPELDQAAEQVRRALEGPPDGRAHLPHA